MPKTADKQSVKTPRTRKPKVEPKDVVVAGEGYEITRHLERYGVDFGVYATNTVYRCTCGWAHVHRASTGQYWQQGTSDEATAIALLSHRLDHVEGKIPAV
jgi:hypothetical protein